MIGRGTGGRHGGVHGNVIPCYTKFTKINVNTYQIYPYQSSTRVKCNQILPSITNNHGNAREIRICNRYNQIIQMVAVELFSVYSILGVDTRPDI